MRIILPQVNQFTRDLTMALNRAFGSIISKDEAASRIMLLDANGVAWEVTVDTSGNLQTAVNTGKTRV